MLVYLHNLLSINLEEIKNILSYLILSYNSFTLNGFKLLIKYFVNCFRDVWSCSPYCIHILWSASVNRGSTILVQIKWWGVTKTYNPPESWTRNDQRMSRSQLALNSWYWRNTNKRIPSPNSIIKQHSSPISLKPTRGDKTRISDFISLID